MGLYCEFILCLFQYIWNSYSEAYLEPSQTSKMKLFCKNRLPLTIFAKISISDARLGSKYASAYSYGYR